MYKFFFSRKSLSCFKEAKTLILICSFQKNLIFLDVLLLKEIICIYTLNFLQWNFTLQESKNQPLHVLKSGLKVDNFHFF